MTRFASLKKNKLILAVLLALAAGCEEDKPGVAVVGGPGTIDGLFTTPRGVALDSAGNLFASDRSGRVQRFNSKGEVVRVWRMPEIDRGRPTSITVAARGDVWVADTHYHRVVKFSPDGERLLQFGREGFGPGEFQYPTGLQVARDGTVFVSEFGGNDRVQVFDAQGRFLRTWGSFGEGPDQFRRPQALALDANRIYVADAGNHRVTIFDLFGKRLGGFGGYGPGPGEMKYPYGLAIAPDGGVFVAEYGNHRIQRFTADGRPLGSFGGAGAEPGRLHTPWNLAAASGRLVVADSGNHRLQIWSLP